MKRSRAPSQLAARKVRAVEETKSRYKNFSIPRTVRSSTKVGFPKQLRMKHRYVEGRSISSDSGGLVTFQYSCNGMFLPNTGGHQPHYFDQLAALYNKYTVLKSKISFQVIQNSATVPASAGVYIEDDTTVTPTTLVALCEQNSAHYGQIPLTTNGDSYRFKKRWDAVEAFGPNPQANDDLQGSPAANPAEQQFFTIFAQPASGATTTNFQIFVTVEYDALWEELKNINTS